MNYLLDIIHYLFIKVNKKRMKEKAGKKTVAHNKHKNLRRLRERSGSWEPKLTVGFILQKMEKQSKSVHDRTKKQAKCTCFLKVCTVGKR